MTEYDIKALVKGIKIGTEKKHKIQVKTHSLHVRIPVDSRKANLWDDRYILEKECSGEKYRQVKTIKDDLIPGDQFVDLKYTQLEKGCTYSLIIDTGDGEEPYYYFKDMAFEDLFS